VEASISSLITAAESGDAAAQAALFSTLYDELLRLARRELARGGAAGSLGAATLVHEAYLDISSRDGPSFPDKARFMAYASRVMRGIIISCCCSIHAPALRTNT
jgi:DNA-directed RNA polymerase specialized sigma24 family protein